MNLKAGDKVLVLLPSTTDKLMARWQGPYEVIRAIGRVNYKIRMHDCKKKRIFHINMLKPWTDPPELPEEMLLATEEDSTSDLDVDWRFDNLTAPLTVGSKLTQQQREQLQQLLEQNGQLLSDKPGHTSLIEHTIPLKEHKSIRQMPYRVPKAYQEEATWELQEMLQHGVIEPTTSAWASPMVDR